MAPIAMEDSPVRPVDYVLNLFVFVATGVVGCGQSQSPPRPLGSMSNSQATVNSALGNNSDSSLDADFAALSRRIQAANTQFPPDAWMVSSEHLFLFDDQLRSDVIGFSRRPRALDLLFQKVLNQKTSDDTLLIIAEICVYFEGYQASGDTAIKSSYASALTLALDRGRTASADQRYGNCISYPLRQAAIKAASR